MSLAFDYNAYIQLALNGFATRLEGLIPKGLLGHQDDLIEKGYIPWYDPEAAKALFQQLGWRGAIQVEMNTADSHYNSKKAFASILKNSIESMNIGINIAVSEMLWFKIEDPQSSPFLIYEKSPDFADPDNYMAYFLHSSKSNITDTISYLNPTLDPMLSAAASESDPSLRNLLYSNLERYIAEENIFMYAYQKTNVETMWMQWNGYEESGSRNPMRNFRFVHFMNKVAQARPCLCPDSSNTYYTNSIELVLQEAIPIFLIIGGIVLLVISTFATRNMRLKSPNDLFLNEIENFNKKPVLPKEPINHKKKMDKLSNSLQIIEEMIDEFKE
jgi:hypothetical protein